MAVPQEFVEAVDAKNILLVRIMLKDSLLLDKTFRQFNEMSYYADQQGVNFWAEDSGDLKIAPRPWDIQLMNYELTALISDFTKPHLYYVINIIKDVYGTRPTHFGKDAKSSDRNNERHMFSENAKDYDIILDRFADISNVLRERNKGKGKRIWLSRDIATIKKMASEIVKACENIQRRG